MCNWLWASHRPVLLLHLALLQGRCGVKKSADTMFPCREILLTCFSCLFPEEMLPREVSNSSPSCFVPFRRNPVPPVKCSPSACAVHGRHKSSGHEPRDEHSLQSLAATTPPRKAPSQHRDHHRHHCFLTQPSSPASHLHSPSLCPFTATSVPLV